MISVLIITRNEERDLPGCLDSVTWSDDVHVFDSESTDRTAEIAASRGAIVTSRAFTSYAEQRNAALSELPFKNPWLLILDADERVIPELAAEIQQAVVAAPRTTCGFRARRRDFLWGTWLKHAQLTPFYIRLVRVGHARYTREINERLEVDGEVANLHEPFDHFPFSKGISHWFAKHNVYSTMEAQLLATGLATQDASLKTALFSDDFSEKRAAQKAIFYKMPARPVFKWIYMMFVRGAILDGRAGITYATLHAIYEYMIVLKTRELHRAASRCACD
jgi:glycosyltransferase involved in cell wall biosynthesis